MLTFLDLATALGVAIALGQYAALLVAIAGLARLSLTAALRALDPWLAGDETAADRRFARDRAGSGWNP